jgi:hypothetical protein
MLQLKHRQLDGLLLHALLDHVWESVKHSLHVLVTMQKAQAAIIVESEQLILLLQLEQ